MYMYNTLFDVREYKLDIGNTSIYIIIGLSLAYTRVRI